MSRPNGQHAVTPFSHDEELAAYRAMLLIRRFEEKAGQLYGMGLIGGFCHLYIGQEAVVVGMQMVIRPGDQVIATYRDHGHMLSAGMDPKGVMAELTGRRGGYSKGKGGSMHMFSREKAFYGGHGIVGANVPLGAGIAFANRYRGNGAVCLTYFGDGAANQGQVYEAFNMAKLWKLPVVFIIENNRYAMGTSIERSAATTDFSQRGRSFDIPGEQVDGMDVRAVKAAGERVVAWVREGNGPYILEMLTYRYRGHSMSDPGKYRTRDEIQKMRDERDPIEQVRRRLLEGGRDRGRAEDDRRRGSRRASTAPPSSPSPIRSRTRASFGRTCWWGREHGEWVPIFGFEVVMTTIRNDVRRRFGDAVADAHAHSIRHRAEIEASDHCGCFYCMGVFSHAEIAEWIRDEGTALCPRCGIDAVLGSASGYDISVPFLKEMHRAWFGSALPAEQVMRALEQCQTPTDPTKATTGEPTSHSNLDNEFAAVTSFSRHVSWRWQTAST